MIVAVVVVASFAIRSMYVCTSLVLSWRHYCRAAESADRRNRSADHLEVLIPALQEQTVMPSTLAHYAVLAEQMPGLRVWVVTAAREATMTPLGEPTTEDVCRTHAAKNNAALGREVFRVLSYPGAGGRRASQLNFAIDRLAAEGSDGYVAVFDADARPDARLGRHVAVAARTQPAMIQQLQLPAFEDGVVRSRSPIMAGQDLYAFRRVFGIEYRRMVLARWCNTARAPWPLRMLLRPMVYGIGSGLIVRREQLDAIDRFQEPHDDLAVGHRLSLAGEPIAVLPSVNVVEPYRDVASLAKAFSSVAFGNAATLADFRFACGRASRLRRVEQRLLLWRALGDGFLWATGPIMLLTAIIVSVLVGPVGVGVTAFALLLNGMVEPILVHRVRRWVLAEYRSPAGPVVFHQASLLRSICTYVTQPVLTSTGPWLLAWRGIVATVMRRPVAFTKTSHVGGREETSSG